jgi:hypothetical protein
MSIKRLDPGTAAGKSDACVVVSGHPVPAVRFELADRTISYLTAEIRRWELVLADQGDERLLITAGNDIVVVTGRGLMTAHTALDQIRLQILREAPARRVSYAEEPWIHRIEVETIKRPKLDPR